MSDGKQQYKSVLKSTSLIGGSAFINIFIGMIRTKFVAVLLGPLGVGLQNMYQTIMTTVSTVTDLGLNSSGVRSIAEANGQNDAQRVARIVNTIRFTVFISGIVGTLLVILLSGYISEFTFKTQEHKVPIIFLSIIVFLTNVQVGQTCILQGLRKIADIAKISVWGAVNSTLISVPCFYILGQKGIVLSLVLTAVASLATSWFYARKISISSVIFSKYERKEELKILMNYGLPQMATALIRSFTDYFMRFIINLQFGLTGLGIWSAAFSISGVLTNFVLNAMGTDYYPRLAAISKDNEKICQEVNTQMEIALLLACPALVITILFAPVGIRILYSGNFDDAIPVLRWYVYGILGRVVTWPLGVIIAAQGRGKLLLSVELVGNIVWLLLTYLFTLRYGLVGSGIAMIVNYIFFFILISIISKIIAQTTIAKTNIKLVFYVIGACLISSYASVNIHNQIYNFIFALLFSLSILFFVYKRMSIKTGFKINEFFSKFKHGNKE